MELDKTNNITKIYLPQEEPKTCLLYNKPEPLFETNGAILTLIMILACLYNFHLRYIIIFLKNNMTCPQYQQPIYSKDDNNTLILLKEEEYIVEKLFKYLSKELQNFSPISKSMDIENSITFEMIFVKIYNKIVQAKKIFEEKICKVSSAKYGVLDSYYLLREVLVKKLAEFEIYYLFQTA
ncbi:hypothetical protein C2G38_2284779 [Gigaspora rosea]|uniref:Uncharacterized protein n=1 Tax=Gigaspora rosea TaxID=44941 RepID=A0A397U5C3_9GLOM|nr:hypothetical protein C2G38_2284779 [Gigaspora rosea]